MPLRPTPLALLAAGLLATALSTADARPKPAAPPDAEKRDAAWQRHQALTRASLFGDLEWRDIGPTGQGGRVVDIEAIPGEPYGFYVAYATGGVWKTLNNGSTFEPLTDDLATMVMGDIAVDPQHPQRLWIGTGEPNSSRSSYGGLGVFRSDDGGKTFVAMGLADSDRISRIVVDPKDGDHVCVAALGKLYTTGGERGVYCTRDGGKSWRQSLAGDTPWTGAIDLVADPRDANVLYAALWDRSRTPWNLVEHGAGSGIYRSDDGGDTWTRLTDGLPGGDVVGRIGLDIARSNGDTIYASIDDWSPLPKALVDLGDRALGSKRLATMSREDFLRHDPDEIEGFIRDSDLDTTLDAPALIDKLRNDQITVAELVKELKARDNGFGDVDIWGLSVFRSDDRGRTWRRTHDAPIRDVTYTYGYYFGQIRVAPDDAEHVYITGVPIADSRDGGRSWKTLQDPRVHVDYHAWWIDPNDPRRMILGNDGGLDLSHDGGKSFVKLDAQPLGQFYTINYDLAEPYNVYGGLQDNGSMKGSSRTRWRLGEDWDVIGGGDGMYVAIDTSDNKTVYTGYQFGAYQRNGADGRGEVRPRATLGAPPLRYNWNTPVVLSPHNPDIVYFGADRLMRSMDRGDTWQTISGDLTTSKQRGDVPYATITTVSESPLMFGHVWVGTDDGHVWVTTSAGERWQRVDDALPADRWVSRVVASGKEKQRAYVSLNGYRNDDIAPYLYVTEDLGKSWRSIAKGLPDEAINVVREDPVNADVLYVGTDRGVYVTLDRGNAWQALDGGLPNVPVHDLAVHPRERELIAGTHGRSAWIVDVLPVQELTAKVRDEKVHVFPLSPLQAERDWRSRPSVWFDERDYLPKIDAPFWAAADGEATLTVLDEHGSVVREWKHAARRGINTARWDVQVDRERGLAAERTAVAKAKAKAAEKLRDDKSSSGTKKPDAAQTDSLANTPYTESVRLGHRLFAKPGDYTLRVTLAGATSETKLVIKAPEARKPRTKPAPKMRGRDDYAGAVQRVAPSPFPREKD
jgi:photosystem II stability/assembly factor-like uncharacterized protein